MSKTKEQLLASAEEIRTNTAPNSNTADLVGSTLKDMINKSSDDKDELQNNIDELSEGSSEVISSVRSDLSSEVARAKAAENAAAAAVTAEETRAKAAESALNTSLIGVKSDMNTLSLVNDGVKYAGLIGIDDDTNKYAANAVPTDKRKVGLIVTYLDKNGNPQTYQFTGSNISQWLTITTWQGIDDVPTAGSDNLVKSGGVQEELALGAVYDVSAKNPTAGTNNDGKFESLSALLGDTNLDTLIPISVRKGGMSIKFVQSSDNKYVQYRYWRKSVTDVFTTTSNWICEDEELNYVEQQVGKKIKLFYVPAAAYWDCGLKDIIPAGSVVKDLGIFTTGLLFYYGNNTNDYEMVDSVPYVLQHDIHKVRNKTITGEGYITLESESLIKNKWDYLFNINAYKNKADAYSSESSALLAIPSYLRTTGLFVTYLLSDGWHTKKYVGSAIDNTNWSNPNNWKEILDEDSEVFYQKEYLQSDENWFTSGYYINAYGDKTAGESGETWYCTDFIPIFNKKIFVNAIYSNHYGARAYCFYDENKNFISAAPAVSGAVTYDNVYIENIPDNARYIRCTTRNTSNQAFVKIRYTLEDLLNKETSLQEQIDDLDIEGTQSKLEQLDSTVFESGEFDKAANLSGIINSGFIMPNSHTIGENDGWIYGKILIPFNSETITFNNLPSAQYQGSVCSYFIDKNNNSISELNGNDYLGAGVVTKDIPSDAVGLMFTAATSALPNYDIKIHINQVSLVEQTQQNKTDVEQLQQEIQAQIEILIPDLIYAIEGTELNIWNDAVSLSIDNSLYSPRNYVIEWICAKGLVTKRCFRFTPTNSDVGTYSCTCSIYSPNTHNLIATKTFQIKVVSKNALNSQKRIVHFGDSLGRSTAEKLYENFNNTDKFTGVIPIMLGTRGTTPHYEAVGGYTWGSYATQGANQHRIQVTGVTSINIGAVYSYNNEQYNIREVNIVDGTGNILLERPYGYDGNIDGVSSGVIIRVSGSGDDTVNFTNCVREPNNPVWDSDLGGLNFAKYRERLGLSSSEKIDAATFQFGVNESLGTPDLTTTLNNYILPLYNAFIADNPNGKFIVGMTTSAGNDVNGAGVNYGADRNTWKYLVNTYNFRKMYLDELQNQYPNLIIASSQLEVDRYYGYDFSSRPISQRTTTTEQYHNNFVHPGSDGYGQLADALFATYVGVLSE